MYIVKSRCLQEYQNRPIKPVTTQEIEQMITNNQISTIDAYRLTIGDTVEISKAGYETYLQKI